MSNSSCKYQQLWSKLTKYAIEPAMRTLTENTARPNEKKALRASGRRGARQRGGKQNRPSRRAKTFGNDEFLAAWTAPIVGGGGAAVRGAVRRQTRGKSTRGRKTRVKASSRQLGGFVRDGSVQHFPCTGGDDAVLGEDVALMSL